MSLVGFWKILRPLNCAMAAVATFIGFSVALHALQFDLLILIAMAAAFLICGAGQAINDYFDRGIDAKLNREKPIPAGQISAGAALVYALVLFAVGNSLAYFLTFEAFLIAIVISALLIIYPALLNRAKYVGNWIVALGTALPLVFGAALVGNYCVVEFFAIAALLANVSREITKDFEDMGKDRGVKKTLPLMLSAEKANLLILFFYFVAIGIAFSVLVEGITSIAYYVLIAAASAGFLYSFKFVLAKDYSRAQSISKKAMLVALLAFFVSIF